MHIKRSLPDWIFDSFNVLIMLALIFITAYPLLFVLFASLSNPSDIVQYRGILWRPQGFTMESYRMVFTNPMILVGYRNTIMYVVGGTLLNMILTTMGAYALSRKNVLLKNPIMAMIVFTMFFSGGLIPSYLLVAQTLNLNDNPLALIIPGAIGTWNLIIMRTAFQSVPEALEEAARMDGANDFTILWNVVLPISMPTVAVMILFYAVGHWNAWFGAMIYLRSREWFPLQIILREILINNNTSNMMLGVGGGDALPIGETIKYATIVVATVPILLVYPFLQRYFTKGVMIGAIKE